MQTKQIQRIIDEAWIVMFAKGETWGIMCFRTAAQLAYPEPVSGNAKKIIIDLRDVGILRIPHFNIWETVSVGVIIERLMPEFHKVCVMHTFDVEKCMKWIDKYDWYDTRKDIKVWTLGDYQQRKAYLSEKKMQQRLAVERIKTQSARAGAGNVKQAPGGARGGRNPKRA